MACVLLRRCECCACLVCMCLFGSVLLMNIVPLLRCVMLWLLRDRLVTRSLILMGVPGTDGILVKGNS